MRLFRLIGKGSFAGFEFDVEPRAASEEAIAQAAVAYLLEYVNYGWKEVPKGEA